MFSYGFRLASGGAGSAVHRRRSDPAGRHRLLSPQTHSAAWPSSAPNDHLVLQTYPVRFLHAFAHIGDQGEHVFGGGMAGIHEEIGVAVADPGVAHGKAFQPEFIDHASGRSAGRISENAPGASLAERLGGAPFFGADTNPLENL